MVRWVVGSIPHDGSIEIFLVLVSISRLVYQRSFYVLSCLWDGVCENSLAAGSEM